jgi:hypothetical protein
MSDGDVDAVYRAENDVVIDVDDGDGVGDSLELVWELAPG